MTPSLILLIAAGTVSASGSPALGAGARAEDRAIFPEQLARQKWAWLAKPPAGFWTPALADVVKLEARLTAYLRDDRAARRAAAGSGPQKNPLWKRAPGYKRQYVGIRRKGRKVIYANFFCEAPSYDWRREPVEVDDGGDCYFQVEYDVDAGRFDSIAVNGGA